MDDLRKKLIINIISFTDHRIHGKSQTAYFPQSAYEGIYNIHVLLNDFNRNVTWGK